MSADITATALTLLAALAVLLGGLWAVLYGVRRLTARGGPSAQGRTLRVLGSTYVGVKKTVILVEVPGAVLVLGVTPERISLLRSIEDKALCEKITGTDAAGPPAIFASQLQKLMRRHKDGD
ncbi:MAG: flagellar biosynthetic protein FliO [Desulfobacterales bacterium]|nr:flagellar biosynthetic protein FliO [Desulfobacterales bacterium]